MRVTSALISILAVTAFGAWTQQFSGAVYTSKGDGTIVNQNLYDSKPDVYLNGGPQNANGSGLPLGTYYFEVTNPSGSVLLSDDNAECRQVVVAASGVSGKGVIFGVPGGGPACLHAEGSVNSSNGSKPVQLIPFIDTPNMGGEYKVSLIAKDVPTLSGCVTTVDPLDAKKLIYTSNCTKSDNFKIRGQNGGGGGGGDPTTFTISGVKYYDANANGVREATEVEIPGWRVDVTFNGVLPPTPTFTAAIGGWAQTALIAGTTFVACEVLPATGSYLQTGPLAGATAGAATANAQRCWTGTVTNADITGLDFGNLCLGAGGGKTLGFWSNRNGEAIFVAALAANLNGLTALNLRNAAGANFDPANYAAYRTWSLGGTATNMSYMLSVQMAAMWLNANNGQVNGGQLIYAPGTGGPSDFKTVNAVIALANASLGTDGLVLAGHPQRAYQEALKNALDRANNNLNFVQGSPCAFTY